MKSVFYQLMLFTFLALGLNSCENDILMEIEASDNFLVEEVQTKSVNELFRANFIYKGNKYKSTYYFEGDSAIFEQKEVGELLNRLNSLPELVTFIYMDQTHEYFDDQEDYMRNYERVCEKNISISQSSSISTFSKGDGSIPGPDMKYSANMNLFDDRNYEDTTVQFNLEKDQTVVEIPQLRNYGMNDKTTSLVLWCNSGTVEYQLWEDNNYKGHSLVYILTSTSLHLGVKGRFVIPNLGRIQVEGTRHTWNDRITSIRMFRR